MSETFKIDELSRRIVETQPLYDPPNAAMAAYLSDLFDYEQRHRDPIKLEQVNWIKEGF